jgi:hypothetical protein
MAKPKDTRSDVIKLLDIVWAGANEATDHSWERLNHAMRDAVQLCIAAGMKFAETDIDHVRNNYRSGYWIGDSREWIYSLAVADGNGSAVKAFEMSFGREPFIADGVTPSQHCGAHMTSERQKERLHVGAYFQWKGEHVKVTSFDDTAKIVIACSYHPGKDGYRTESKIKKRYKITREDIIEDRAERKERDKLDAELVSIGEKAGLNNRKIVDKLGIKTRQEFDTLPTAKIRKVLDELKKKAAS